jgi:hypothetical protein
MALASETEIARLRHKENNRRWARANPDKVKADRDTRAATGYYREWQKTPTAAAWRKQRYADVNALLAAIKLERGCADCGYRKDPRAMDFDHVRGEKSFNLSQSGSIKLERILAEVEKCDVVCANCHRIRTFDRGRIGEQTLPN